MSISAETSLFEDWQTRRRGLETASNLDASSRQLQIQLLDYLLNRYRDDPQAQRPARFPAVSQLRFNERAILVLHHFKVGPAKTTRNIFDVHDRISGIVDRMAQHPAEPESANHIATAQASTVALTQAPSLTARICDLWRAIAWEASSIWRARSKSKFRRKKVRRLFHRYSNPKYCNPRLLEKLLALDYQKTKYLALDAWADRRRAGCQDEVTGRLFQVVSRFNNRELDQVRMMLADDNHNLRVAAIETLGQCASLDDVGLLSDLLALPPQTNEEPGERSTLRAAIQQVVSRISGRATAI
jgi:hypothetical protein